LWTIVFSPSGCPVPPQKNIGIGELASGSLTIKKRLKFGEFGARLSFDYKPRAAAATGSGEVRNSEVLRRTFDIRGTLSASV